MPGVVEENPSLSDLEKAADLADIKADAAEVVFGKANSAEFDAEAAVNTAQAAADEAQAIATVAVRAYFLKEEAAAKGGAVEKAAAAMQSIAANKATNVWNTAVVTAQTARTQAKSAYAITRIANTAARRASDHLARGFERRSNLGWVLCKSPERCCHVDCTNKFYCCFN